MEFFRYYSMNNRMNKYQRNVLYKKDIKECLLLQNELYKRQKARAIRMQLQPRPYSPQGGQLRQIHQGRYMLFKF